MPLTLVKYVLVDQGDEDRSHTQYESILSMEQLIMLAGENFDSTIGGNKIPISNVTDSSSPMHAFLCSAVAKVAYEYVDEDHEVQYSSSLLIDKLCEYYATQDNNCCLKQFFYNLHSGDDALPIIDDGYIECRDNNIFRVFGSANGYKDFYKFIQMAFADQIDEVNAQLKNLQMAAIDAKAIDEKKPSDVK